MKVLYPYNEILPTRRAHDTYVVHNCASLAAAGLDVELLVGKGTPPDILNYYGASSLDIRRLPIIRRNNPLGVSWNFRFHWAAQAVIASVQPDVVINSVRKQGAYHHHRKLPDTSYIYEVHELVWYPGHKLHLGIQAEREMLDRADLIVTTTEALAKILREPPYSLLTPIEVVPLAVQATRLPPPPPHDKLRLAFVGQLFREAGLDLLLKAVPDNVELHLIGNLVDIDQPESVHFHGFQPPSQLPDLLQNMDAFVMPSARLVAKPDVAHTKLYEYCNWGRPLIAPDHPTVHSHLGSRDGVEFYELGSAESLRTAITQLQDDAHRQKLSKEMAARPLFTWEARAEKYLPLIRGGEAEHPLIAAQNGAHVGGATGR